LEKAQSYNYNIRKHYSQWETEDDYLKWDAYQTPEGRQARYSDNQKLISTLQEEKKNMVGGAVSLIIGIAILVLGWLAAQIVLLVLGILIAIKGVVALLDALQKRKTTLLGVLFPVLTIIVGVMLAFGNGLDIMILIVGILLMVDGILGLLNAAKK
jgi:uncharacterized membrane protein HdeD (DUF308 family)